MSNDWKTLTNVPEQVLQMKKTGLFCVTNLDYERKKMLLKAETNTGFKPTPAGVYMARCYRIIDLGTQETTWQGNIKHQRKVLLSWEIHGEDDTGKPLLTDDGRPLMASKRFTASLGEKAALRAFVESWRGKPFTDPELRGYDLKSLLGQWGMINITEETREGKVYSNVKSVMPLPPALRKVLPAGHNEVGIFSMEQFSPDMMDLFNSFGKGLQDTIKASPEWARIGSLPAKQVASLEDADDDIPF